MDTMSSEYLNSKELNRSNHSVIENEDQKSETIEEGETDEDFEEDMFDMFIPEIVYGNFEDTTENASNTGNDFSKANNVQDFAVQLGIISGGDERNSDSRGTNTNVNSPIRRYKCEICFKTFDQKCKLTAHYNSHSGEKPYKCEMCIKSFSSRANLTNHYRIHLGIRPYKCSKCDRAFTKRSALDMHDFIHTGYRPYVCEVCKKAFNQKGCLNVHYRTHTGERPYECDVCRKCFTTSSHLKVHYRIHTGSKPYRCDKCQQVFRVKDLLVKHVLTCRGGIFNKL